MRERRACWQVFSLTCICPFYSYFLILDLASPPSPQCTESSHPHGKRYNLATATLAIIALAVDAGVLSLFFYRALFYLPIISTRLLCSGAGMGTIAMIVSFTASCRAYRRRGLKWIASLYGLVFLCHFFSFAELIVWSYMDWWWCDSYSCSIMVGISSALWLVCIILALSVPPFDTLDNNKETINNGPRGDSVYPNPQNNQGDEEDAYIRVKTVTAVPIPLPGLEEPPSHNNARLRRDAGPLDP